MKKELKNKRKDVKHQRIVKIRDSKGKIIDRKFYTWAIVDDKIVWVERKIRGRKHNITDLREIVALREKVALLKDKLKKTQYRMARWKNLYKTEVKRNNKK